MIAINNVELERIALSNKEWNTICFLLDNYASDFVEGGIDSAREQFSSLFHKIPLEVVSMYKDFTVFTYTKDICAQRIDAAVSAAEMQAEEYNY